MAEVLRDLAEHVEVADPLRSGVALHRGREPLPERVVDVLHRVHPEAVDAELADPELVDVDHPVDDARVLREEVVEPEEVAVQRVLADEGRVAAVVVEAHVVEPGGDLDVLLDDRDAGAVGEAAARLALGSRTRRLPARCERGERAAAGEVAVVEDRPGGGPVRILVLGDVDRRGALLVADDVGRVVGDDVEVDLHPEPVGVADEQPQVVVAAQVRVDLSEVGDPVAVVAGGGEAVVVLDRLVLEARRQPDRGGSEALDVVETLAQALEVAAVVPALALRLEARLAFLHPWRQAAVVVGRRSVLEAVGHDEVEVLVGDRLSQAVTGVAAGPGRSGQDGGDEGDG